MTEAAESAAVLAFIRERQAPVLADAIAHLADCPDEDLADVAHAVSGALGSYQLTEAYEAVMRLRRTLSDPDVTPPAVATERASTVAELRRLQEASA